MSWNSIKFKVGGKLCAGIVTLIATSSLASGNATAATAIVHDAEYYILETQNGERWAADDKDIDPKLAAFRK